MYRNPSHVALDSLEISSFRCLVIYEFTCFIHSTVVVILVLLYPYTGFLYIRGVFRV